VHSLEPAHVQNNRDRPCDLVREQGREASELDNLHNCHNSTAAVIESPPIVARIHGMTETRTRIERSGKKWTGAELRAACDESKAFWASPEGIAARKRQGTPKPIKQGIHPTVLAARKRLLK